MALRTLGSIVVNNSFGTWSAGNLIIIYFDDSTLSVKTYRSAVLETSGENLVINLSNNLGKEFVYFERDWSRVYTGYEARIGNTEYKFRPLYYYPYFAIETKDVSAEVEEAEGESNEISISLTSTTKASNSTAKDGQIVVASANGNFVPRFALEKPDYTNGQTSGTFSNLPAGRYTIYVTDSTGYFASTTVSLGFSGNQYAPKWRVNFTDNDGADGRIDICERGQIGEPLVINGAGTPYTYSTRGEGEDLDGITFINGQVEVSIVNTEQDQYLAIPQADDEQFIAKIYHDLGSGLELIFQGYVNPSSYSDTYMDRGYVSSFNANDRLAYLSNFHFLRADTFVKGGFKNEEIRGRNSQMSAIKVCLDKTNLAQGFRIACNIFETNQTQTNTSVFHETYYNADVYIKDEVPEKCDVVLKQILSVYNAMLVSWQGYWYIVRQKELLDDTVNYKEFDEDGVYVTAGTFSPKIEFKDPTATDRFRWIKGVSRLFTNTVRNINAVIDTVVREGGFIDHFSITQAVQVTWENLSGFKNFTLKKGNTNFSHQLINKGSLIDRKDYWRMQIRENANSNTYMLWNKNIDHYGNDKCVLRIKYNVQALYNALTYDAGSSHVNPPYAALKWRLRLGGRYLTSEGLWTTTNTINQHFVTNFDKDDEFEKVFDLPEGGTVQNESFQLRVYPVSFFESETTGINNAAMITALEGVTTTSMRDGQRRICKAGVSGMRFYELQVTADAENDYYIVEPDDYHASTNNRRWVLVSENFYYNPDDLNSTTDFDYIELDYLPGGNEPVEEIEEVFSNSDNNRLDKEVVIHQFDLTNTFNNDEKLFLNYNTLSDGTPTEFWQEVGGGPEKSLLAHKVDWIQRLTKKARIQASGQFITDKNFSPLNVLYDPNDRNLIFYPNGVSCNYKTKIHSGELTEISSDDLPTNSAFDIQAFDQDQFQ